MGKILVVGDVMLDVYCEGVVNRISPEAPVPILKKNKERYVLGGAANVVSNLIASENKTAVLTLVGKDNNGRKIKKMLSEIGADISMIREENRPTTTKTRFIAENNQQVMRMDIERTEPISERVANKLINLFISNITQFDIVLVSDYSKGLLTPYLLGKIINISNEHNKKVLIDVKGEDFIKYKGAWLLKPNISELKSLTKMPISSEEELIIAAKFLRKETKCEYVLTTCGSKGMVLVGEKECHHLETVGKEVYDVTGAGDTTIAYLAGELSNGNSIIDAMEVANYAAGIQVGKVGTSAVALSEVKESMRRNQIDSKIYYINQRKELKRQINEWRKKGEIIVTTNGCFDILHKGHVVLLEEAKKRGDRLIILLNTDESVRRLKGETRPINKENDRALVLSALSSVDAVVLFNPEKDNLNINNDLKSMNNHQKNIAKEAPMGIMKIISPDIHVKGGDYSKKDVPEAIYAKSFVSIPYIDGYSSSLTIQKTKNLEK